jgi:tRNA pseudouridine13 synthase
MREAHPGERAVGIGHYVSDADGIGGRLRETPEDFRVREIEAFDSEPLDVDPGSYGRLVVRATLRAWDTNDFAGRLSDALGISRERVSWAGTKDKHAVTTQLFTIKGVEPASLPGIEGAEIEAVGRAGRDLGFGDLAGNEFEITVRDPERPENVDAITADLAGFAGVDDPESEGLCDGDGDADGGSVPVAVPNYFGQQRFGSIRPVTHEVGLRVLRGDWRGAVLAYVGNPHEDEPEDTREARAFVDEQAASDDPDWAAALDRVPGRLRYERSMLHRLDVAADTDEDWRYALEAVPSNLQRLFVNAAQSFVFNRIVSERLERGIPFDRPVAGDVVCFADRDAPDGLAYPAPDREQRVDEGRVDVVTRHCERGRAFVTAPLVGRESELAEGDPGEIEREVLADLDLSPSDFDLPGEFDSRGTRRAILLRTDLTIEGGDDAPTFRFALPSGSYATVLLREYLKSGPLEL